MTLPHGHGLQALSDEQLLEVNRLCDDAELLWKAGERPTIEDLVADWDETARWAAIEELIALEVDYRRTAGEQPRAAEYLTRFSGLDPAWLRHLLGDQTLPQQLGDYQLGGLLGSGGIGRVYLATHVRMGRRVALKVVRPELQRDPNFISRFDREVRAAATLHHPNIVTAFDAREESGVYFLIMEYVDGQDLDQYVRQRGPLPFAVAVDCVLQAAAGLDHAHRQGVVHRDIKPANLLRSADGVVKILDMGLARLNEPHQPVGPELTQSGMLLGTAAYIAPEQARDTRRADARSDFYSLGCTLFFLLTGRGIFAADSAAEAVAAHLYQPPPSLRELRPDLPAELDGVFQRLVAKNPEDRFPSARKLLDELRRIQQAYQPTESPLLVKSSFPALATSHGPNNSKRPAFAVAWLWAAGGTALIASLAVAAIVGGWLPDGRGVANRETPRPGVSQTYRPARLVFDGQSSYAVIADLRPQPGATYTLESWVEPRAARTSNVISWLGPDWMAIYFSSNGSWGLGRRWGPESIVVQHPQPAQLGRQVHVAGVFAGERLTLFIDGQPVLTDQITFPLPQSQGGLYIGGVAPGLLPAEQNDRFFSGVIRQVRVSSGARYDGPFSPPRNLLSDDQTLAAVTFDREMPPQFTTAGANPWPIRLVNTRWEAVRNGAN